jgi:hypothetical protein
MKFLSYLSWRKRLQVHIVNYGDDFIILRHRKEAGAQAQMIAAPIFTGGI